MMKYRPFFESREKENNMSCLKKAGCRKSGNYRQGHFSLTQSQFTSKKNSMKNISNLNMSGAGDFCQTLTFGFGNDWVRPESKQASRRQPSRPETSKGGRNRISFYNNK